MKLQSPRHDPYSTLEQTKRELGERGYTATFVLSPEGNALQDENGKKHLAKDLVVNETRRLVNKENEAEKTTLYVLSAADGTKGIAQDGYGKESSEELTNFMLKVESREASPK